MNNVTFTPPTPEIAAVFHLDTVNLASLRALVEATPDWPAESPVEFKLPLSMQTDEEEFTASVKIRALKREVPSPPLMDFVGSPASPRIIHRREEIVSFHPGTLLRSVENGSVYKMVRGSARMILLYTGMNTSVNTDQLLQDEPAGLEVIWLAPEEDPITPNSEDPEDQ